jgi:hypothetical protein
MQLPECVPACLFAGHDSCDTIGNALVSVKKWLCNNEDGIYFHFYTGIGSNILYFIRKNGREISFL